MPPPEPDARQPPDAPGAPATPDPSDPSDLSSDPPGLSSDPAGLSSDPAGLSSDPPGLSGEVEDSLAAAPPGHRGPVLRRLGLAVLLLLQLGLVVWPVVYWEGGVIDAEATVFVPQYLADRPLAARVFDPRLNDFGAYQARELSYLADLVDAHVLDLLLRHDVVLLVPASALLGGLLLCLVVPPALRRALPELGDAGGALCLLVFLSHFVWLSSAGLFYRSGKLLLAPLLVLLGAAVLEAARRGEGAAAPRGAAVCLLAVLASLLDRQGFFEVVLLAALAAGAALAGRATRGTAAGLGVASLLATVYNVWLAPALVEALNGYRPRFRYQSIDPQALTRKLYRWTQGAELLAGDAGLLLGGLPAVAVLALAGVIGVAWLRRPGPRGPRLLLLGGALAALAGQWVMLVLMIVRHKVVYEYPDHRVVYYPLTVQVLGLLGLATLVALAVRLWGRPARLVALAGLAALVAANVAAWPRLHASLTPWFPHIEEQSARLRRSLASGEAVPGLAADQLALFEALRSRRAPR